MAGQYSIKETKELLDVAIAGAHAGFNIAADGKVDMNDLQHVLPMLPVLQPGFDKIDQVPKELGELDAQEAADLVAHVTTKLAVSDEKAKIYINYGLKMVHKAYLIVVDFRDMKAELAKVVV